VPSSRTRSSNSGAWSWPVPIEQCVHIHILTYTYCLIQVSEQPLCSQMQASTRRGRKAEGADSGAVAAHLICVKSLSYGLCGFYKHALDHVTERERQDSESHRTQKPDRVLHPACLGTHLYMPLRRVPVAGTRHSAVSARRGRPGET